MKNFMKKIALVAIAFLAFSCSEDKQPSADSVSIADTAKATPDLSSFVEALDITGLTDTLDADGNFTVMAPTNDAFSNMLSNLGYSSLQDLEDNQPGVLSDILKYHVISGASVFSKDLTNGQSVATLLGQNFTVDLEANTYYPEIDPDLYTTEQTSIFIKDSNNDSARVFARDVRCTNGLIHVINAVLMPSSN
ncbi:fasciclin domain-containing protein [Flavobacterium sp.]|uniref:fasciclin domain-containing protein n=1 Tax=Flavobacterium sp. TaxID=239 RepID=UPI002FDA3B56